MINRLDRDGPASAGRFGNISMVLRGLQALIGAILSGGGGYLAWMNRGAVNGLFPPQPGLSVWAFVGGLVLAIVGAVAIVHAVGPRPKAKAKRQEESERRESVLKDAENFYAERAEARVDGFEPRVDRNAARTTAPLFQDEPPPPAYDPFPEHLKPPGRPADAVESDTSGPTPRLMTLSHPPPGLTRRPAGNPAAHAEPSTAASERGAGVATPVVLNGAVQASAPREVTGHFFDPLVVERTTPFPAPISSSPAPRASDPPPERLMGMQSAAMTAVVEAAAPAASAAIAPPVANGALRDAARFVNIRAAISENRLKEADELLAASRKTMNEKPSGDPLDLAELTGLAGDHAAADGRLGSAKWLWRLALQRFAAAGAIDDPAARAVSERMRLADQ